MYRITYEQGNGYNCSCCRRSWTETVDFETPEEVQAWVNELYADRRFPSWEDADDREIESIEKEIGVDIQDQFKPQQDIVDQLIASRKKEKEDEERADEEEKARLKEETYRAEYERLKNKFEK